MNSLFKKQIDEMEADIDSRWHNWRSDPDFWKRDIKDVVGNHLSTLQHQILEAVEKKMPDALHEYAKWVLENPEAEPLTRRAKKNEIISGLKNKSKIN